MKRLLLSLGVLLLMSLSVTTQAQNLSKDKFGKGLTIDAADSSFAVKFGFRFQTLYVGEMNAVTNAYEDNFLTRRARLKFDGFAYNPAIQYKVELALSNRDHSSGQIDESKNTANIVLDAVMKWDFTDNWSIWFGQTKLPGNRERVISS
ncbi:MAG: OprO/OprP family phosphate-selective porin, partial [Cyclobacteriaceae bacterium]|nr:OprO/OprP family phosphate-selective porin [Cyclobacteriaceae bacterium]